MQKRPIYQFNTDTETGINKVPVGALVVCLNSGGVVKHFQLINKTGIVAGTTIAQAITAGNLTLENVHTHSIAEIANLQATLDAKAALKATSTVFGGIKASVSGTTLTINLV